MDVLNVPKYTDPSYLTGKYDEYLFIFACMFTQLYYQAVIAQPLTSMNVITAHFGANTDEQNWYMASVGLATGTLVLASGRFGDVYGLKKMMVGGYIWTIIWLLLAGFSYYINVTFFIIARTFVGIGMAFIIPNMMGIVGTIYTPRTKRKNIVFALVGACAPFGAAMGLFWSGLIAHFTNRWDWTMYATAIGVTIAFVISWKIVPNNLPKNVLNVRMDWMGSLLGIVGLVLFNFAWNEAPAKGFQTGYIIALLVIGVVALVAFAIWESKFASSPLIPKTLRKADSKIPLILLAMFFGWGSFGIWLLYYFRFLFEFREYGNLHVAWTTFPILISGITAAMLVGQLFQLFRVEFIFLASMCAFTLPCILLAVAPVNETFWRTTFGASLVIAFGMDLSYPAASIVLSDTLPPDCQGMAGSLTNTIVGYSTSIFLGFGAFIEAQLLKNGQDKLDAFRATVYFAVGCGGFAILIALLTLGLSFRKQLTPPSESTVESVKSSEI